MIHGSGSTAYMDIVMAYIPKMFGSKGHFHLCISIYEAKVFVPNCACV